MKTSIKALFCLCGGLMLAACAAPLQTGPADEVSPEGLQRMTGSPFDEVWVRSGRHFGSYQEVVLEPTQVAYREVDERPRTEVGTQRLDRDAFPIPADQRARIERGFQDRMAQALDTSTHYRRVGEPAPGVLSVRATLVDFVSKVPPEGRFGKREAYVTSVGEATLVIELWDSERDELLARAVDRSEAGPHGVRFIRANHVTSWSEIDVQMQRWAGAARALVDELYGMDGA